MAIASTLLACTDLMYAQGDPDMSRDTSKAVSEDVRPSTHSLYLSGGYGDNMVYMGSVLSEKKPYYLVTGSYGYKDNIFASASLYHLSAFDPTISFSTFSLSYLHNLGKSFDVAATASWYSANNTLTDTLFSSFMYGSASLGLDWNILYTNLTVSGIISAESSLYLSLKNSRYFETPRFFREKANLYFDPYFSLLFGSLTKTVTSEGTVIGVSAPFKSKKSSTSGHGSSGTTSTYFSAMELDLGLPVGLNLGKFSFEANPGYIIPLYDTSDDLAPSGFSIQFSITMKLF